jgi:uncharacterized cupin superfamily protein
VLTHWDDVEPLRIERGDLRGLRRRLGAAAGAPRLGLSRYEMAANERVMPQHLHSDEEEIFVVLGGAGLSVEGDEAFAIAAGDAILYPAGGRAHTIVAGPGGIDVLAFGDGGDGGLTWLPRPNVMWAAPRWLPLDGPNPFQAEADAGPLELPAVSAQRPPTISAIASVEAQRRTGAGLDRQTRWIGQALGAVRSGLSEIVVAPGGLSNLPHSHSTEDELFVVTAGDGVLELMDAAGEDAGRHEIRTGHVVSLPAGSRVAHAFRAGSGGLTLLAYARHDRADMCFYPRSQKISFRGLGIIVRVDRVDYWDGEE